MKTIVIDWGRVGDHGQPNCWQFRVFYISDEEYRKYEIEAELVDELLLTGRDADLIIEGSNSEDCWWKARALLNGGAS